MKPAWDQLSEEFPGVYDVDCTADGKELCEKVGVSGYPTIKYGSADDLDSLQKYEGGRDFDSLKKFAEENLGPVCGPKTLDACSDEEKAQIAKFSAQPLAELEAELKKQTKQLDDKQKKFGKKRRKFDEKDKDFQDEWKEYQSDKRNTEKAKQKLEKNEKATKAEKSKQADKDKKVEARGAKLEKKKEALDKDRKVYDDEKDAIDAEVKGAGLKLMTAVKDAKNKDEL